MKKNVISVLLIISVLCLVGCGREAAKETQESQNYPQGPSESVIRVDIGSSTVPGSTESEATESVQDPSLSE